MIFDLSSLLIVSTSGSSGMIVRSIVPNGLAASPQQKLGFAVSFQLELAVSPSARQEMASPANPDWKSG